MIKATDYISEEAKKEAEQVALAQLANGFTEEVVKSIFAKIEEFKGWDDPVVSNTLKQKLLEAYQTGDMVNVSAYAMLLWNLNQK